MYMYISEWRARAVVRGAGQRSVSLCGSEWLRARAGRLHAGRLRSHDAQSGAHRNGGGAQEG